MIRHFTFTVAIKTTFKIKSFTCKTFPTTAALANLKSEMYTNKNHIFSLDELALNIRITSAFHQIMESPSEQIQNHNSFQEILWSQYELTNEVTAANSPDMLDSIFGSREYHSSFIGGDYTDVDRTYQDETIVNDSFEEHSSNTESNSRLATSEVVHVLNSISEPPENHTIFLGRCCFYLNLTDLNTETIFDFVEKTTGPHDFSLEGMELTNESIVKENCSINTDELAVIIENEE